MSNPIEPPLAFTLQGSSPPAPVNEGTGLNGQGDVSSPKEGLLDRIWGGVKHVASDIGSSPIVKKIEGLAGTIPVAGATIGSALGGPVGGALGGGEGLLLQEALSSPSGKQFTKGLGMGLGNGSYPITNLKGAVPAPFNLANAEAAAKKYAVAPPTIPSSAISQGQGAQNDRTELSQLGRLGEVSAINPVAAPGITEGNVLTPTVHDQLVKLSQLNPSDLGAPKGPLGGLMYVLQGLGAGLAGHPDQALGQKLMESRMSQAQNLLNKAEDYKYSGLIQQEMNNFRSRFNALQEYPEQQQMLWKKLSADVKLAYENVNAQSEFKSLMIQKLMQTFGTNEAGATAVLNQMLAGPGSPGAVNFGSVAPAQATAGALQGER